MMAGIFGLARLPLRFKTNLYHREHQGKQRYTGESLRN